MNRTTGLRDWIIVERHPAQCLAECGDKLVTNARTGRRRVLLDFFSRDTRRALIQSLRAA